MELKKLLFYGVSMEIPVILTLVFFHCYTNENNSDLSFRIDLLSFHCFLLLFF